MIYSRQEASPGLFSRFVSAINYFENGKFR